MKSRKPGKQKKSAGAFRLRKASFRGKGLQQGAKDAGWERLRSLAYADPVEDAP